MTHLNRSLEATKDELGEAKKELQKLLKLEAIMEEMKSVKKNREKAEHQYNSTHHELVLSQQNVSALEDRLSSSERQYRDAQLELEALEGEREDIDKQVAELNLTLGNKMVEHKIEVTFEMDKLNPSKDFFLNLMHNMQYTYVVKIPKKILSIHLSFALITCM